MNTCKISGCQRAAMQGSDYCANHAPYHGTCPACGLHYTSAVDRAYVLDYGVCCWCHGKREAVRRYAERQAVRRE
jgi:hypothetical protein